MSNIIENLSYVLPVFITAVMVIFLWFRRKTEVEFREISRSISYLDDEKDNKNSNIEKLVTSRGCRASRARGNYRRKFETLFFW